MVQGFFVRSRLPPALSDGGWLLGTPPGNNNCVLKSDFVGGDR